MRHPLTIVELALARIELAHSRIPLGASNDDDFAHGDDCITDFVDALPLPEHERKRTTEALLYFLLVRTYHEAAYDALDLKEHIGYLAFPAGFAERRVTIESQAVRTPTELVTNDGQRAMVAARIANLPNGTNRFVARPNRLATPTQADAASMLNVSERQVRRARRVLARAEPEVIAEAPSPSPPKSARKRKARRSRS